MVLPAGTRWTLALLVISAACTNELPAPTSLGGPDSDGAIGDAAVGCPADYCANVDCRGCRAFDAIADTFFDANVPSQVFGDARQLLVDGSPLQHAALRFAVLDVGADLQRATLRLFVVNSADEGPAVFLTHNEWDERTATWDTRPAARGDAIATMGDTPRGWSEVEVGNSVATAGVYSFLLTPSASGEGADFSSREGLHIPQLLVVFGRSGE